MIIAGTSMNVVTPFVFVQMMKSAKKPVIIINNGPTQVDDMSDVIINMNITDAFEHIAENISSPVYI